MSDIEFRACADGNHRLTLQGGRPGPHEAKVRAIPSGLPLGFPTWLHDQTVTLLLPDWVDRIAVQVDKDPETGAWLEEVEVEVVALEDQDKPRRKGKPPTLATKERKELDELAGELHKQAARPEDFTPEARDPKPAKPPKGKSPADLLALQHFKAEHPEWADDTPVEVPVPPLPKPSKGKPRNEKEREEFERARVEQDATQDPVTKEEKEVQHDRAEFPVSAEPAARTDIEGSAPERAKLAKAADKAAAPPLRTPEEAEKLARKEEADGFREGGAKGFKG